MAQSSTGYRVGEVAALAGVTIRTLHHYEQIGLLVPGGRTESGYRVYSSADIDRLSRVLYYRALGFSLDDIASLLDDASISLRQHLERQHELLRRELQRVQTMVLAIEREMEAAMSGYNLTAEEKLEVFGDSNPDQYDAEVRERWGDTDAFRQSQERTASYDKHQWLAMQAEMKDIGERFAGLLRDGTPATSKAAMDLAEEHRSHISRWFYDCSLEIHRCLGEMYVDDHRFTENIDQGQPGLAAYMRDAIAANADRAGI
jgi:DNA-binding transcriptional MerR regulator